MLRLNRINLSSEWLLIAGLVLVKLVLHVTTNTNYELHRDAFLYLAQGDHLAFGYMSVPPFTAVIGKLGTMLMGDSVFAVRLLPALTGVFSVILIALIVKELGGRLWALALAGLAFILSAAYLRSNTLFQPVSFDQFFWLWASYLTIRLLRTGEHKYWYFLAAVCGIGFLNKYSIAFFVVALLLALLMTPERKLMATKHFAFALLLGFAIVLPNLIWQFQHNWPVVHHMRELQETQLVHVNIFDFIVMQFLMNLHAVIIWMAGLGYFLLSRQARNLRAVGYMVLWTLILLILLRGKHYYTLGIYPVLFAAGGVAIEQLGRGRWRVARPLLLVLMAALAIPLMPYSLPLLPLDKMARYAEASKDYGLEGALRWEDGRIHSLPQDYADMTGWKEIGQLVVEAYQSLTNEQRQRCLIFAQNYGQAGAVKYHTEKHGLPEPVCFNGSFLFWAPSEIDLEVLIYLNHELGDDIKSYFGDITLAGELKNPFARENGLKVFICTQPRDGLTEFYAGKVERLKSQFTPPK